MPLFTKIEACNTAIREFAGQGAPLVKIMWQEGKNADNQTKSAAFMGPKR